MALEVQEVQLVLHVLEVLVLPLGLQLQLLLVNRVIHHSLGGQLVLVHLGHHHDHHYQVRQVPLVVQLVPEIRQVLVLLEILEVLLGLQQ